MARAFRFNLNALGSLTLLVGMFLVKIRVTVVRSHEAVTDADHVIAAVVLVITHEHIQLIVERDIVNVSQPG